MYRNLNFHPVRGKETIEKDVEELQCWGVRSSISLTAQKALQRWRRHHTRANVQEICLALRKIKRFDILKAIHENFLLTSNRNTNDQTESKEVMFPPIEAKLIPFFNLIERYDKAKRLKNKDNIMTSMTC